MTSAVIPRLSKSARSSFHVFALSSAGLSTWSSDGIFAFGAGPWYLLGGEKTFLSAAGAAGPLDQVFEPALGRLIGTSVPGRATIHKLTNRKGIIP